MVNTCVASREDVLLVTLWLLGPALVVGALVSIAVRRHPGADPSSPSSPRVAGAVAHERVLLGLALVVLVAGGVVLALLALLVRTSSDLLSADRAIAPWGEAHATPFARWMLDVVTSFGTTRVIVGCTVAVFVVEMVRRPSRWLPVFLVAVAVGQTLTSTAVKDLVDRVRPTANPIAATLGPSFPSGHTTGAAACFAAYALVAGRGRTRRVQSLLAGAAVFVAVAVAASRVLLGVHWLSDVIGGLALGWAWFALCSIAFGGRLLRLGAPVEAAERVTEARSSTPPPRDPVP